jgi:nucleoside-diphosphate-sugar epimerase
MKVFIAGATGVLGRRLVASLAERGHTVHGLARDEAGEQVVESRGGTVRRGDVLEPESLDSAIDDDVEVLVHAATAIPDSAKPSDEEWARNDRVRLDGMENLLAVAPDGLQQVLFPSVVWVVRQPDGSAFDETADYTPDRATESAAEVEQLLQRRADSGSFDAAILRCGFFYAPDSRDTREWGQQLLAGDLPIVGGGLLGHRDGTMSFVHADDAARAFVAAIEREVDGIYHVIDDEPVAGSDFFETFAELLDAPEPSRIPGWVARFFVGKIAADLLTSDWPTTNEKAKRDLDWKPTYPTYEEGLRQIVETWEGDETLQELRGEPPEAVAAR